MGEGPHTPLGSFVKESFTGEGPQTPCEVGRALRGPPGIVPPNTQGTYGTS